jgi:hypothetical protein
MSVHPIFEGKGGDGKEKPDTHVQGKRDEAMCITKKVSNSK